MIGKLTGYIEHLFEDSLILNVQGVGYTITVPSHILHKVKQGDPLSLFIEMLIRPELIHLYGFSDLAEKSLFQKLMSVQGIGGKSAAAILSIMNPQQILDAIASQDAAAFKRAEGIGPKVATRILTELKDYAAKQGGGILPLSKISQSTEYLEDALSTLLQLGYKRYEAQHALQKAVQEMPDANIEVLIPLALKLLSKKFLD